jgi:hypothetical protein
MVQHSQTFIALKEYRDQIAAKGQSSLWNFYSYTGRFQRCPTSVVFLRLITEQGEVGHITARRIPLRDGANKKRLRSCAESVNGGFMGGFQRGFPPEFWHWGIAHAVADKKNVFHKLLLYSPPLPEKRKAGQFIIVGIGS